MIWIGLQYRQILRQGVRRWQSRQYRRWSVVVVCWLLYRYLKRWPYWNLNISLVRDVLLHGVKLQVAWPMKPVRMWGLGIVTWRWMIYRFSRSKKLLRWSPVQIGWPLCQLILRNYKIHHFLGTNGNMWKVSFSMYLFRRPCKECKFMILNGYISMWLRYFMQEESTFIQTKWDFLLHTDNSKVLHRGTIPIKHHIATI